jgi:hypothetical protein
MENKQKYITGAIVIAVIIIIIGFFVTKSASAPTSGKYDGFAKCVVDKGLTMYGAAWCSHCQKEKVNFGDSFKYITYVECPDNIKLCTDKGVNGYPTWIDADGKKYEGEQGLDGLAKITGCTLPN